MIVIKHDEAENARAFDLDREAWVMLVGFLEDLRNAAVKVYLNDDAKIPDSVKVNAGLPNNGRSWTVSVFVLKKKSVPELPDEEAVVTQGPLHPMPVQAPRWTGPGPPGRSDASPAGSQADNATDVKLEDATAEGIEPAVRVEEVEVAN